MVPFNNKLAWLFKKKLQKKKKSLVKEWKPPVSPGKAAWQKRKLRRKKYKLIKKKRRKKWVKFRRKLRLKRSRNRRVMRSIHVFNSKLKFKRPVAKHFAKLFKKTLISKINNSKPKYPSNMFYRPFIKFKLNQFSAPSPVGDVMPNIRMNFFKEAALNTTQNEIDEYTAPSEAFSEALPMMPKTEFFDNATGFFAKKVSGKKVLYSRGLKAELKLYRILEDNEKASKWMSNVKERRKDEMWRLKQWHKVGRSRVRVGKRISPAVAQANAYRHPIRSLFPIFRSQFSNILYRKKLKLINIKPHQVAFSDINYYPVTHWSQFQQARKFLTKGRQWYILPNQTK